MNRPVVQFNDVVSFGVLLLMLLAIVAGQAEAGGARMERGAVEVKSSQIRGEDE